MRDTCEDIRMGTSCVGHVFCFWFCHVRQRRKCTDRPVFRNRGRLNRITCVALRFAYRFMRMRTWLLPNCFLRHDAHSPVVFSIVNIWIVLLIKDAVRNVLMKSMHTYAHVTSDMLDSGKWRKIERKDNAETIFSSMSTPQRHQRDMRPTICGGIQMTLLSAPAFARRASRM